MTRISGLILLSGLVSLAAGASLKACNNLRIDSEWGTGMSADLDVTSDHDGTGYTLVMTWDKPISDFQQWVGSASSNDQK